MHVYVDMIVYVCTHVDMCMHVDVGVCISKSCVSTDNLFVV